MKSVKIWRIATVILLLISIFFAVGGIYYEKLGSFVIGLICACVNSLSLYIWAKM